MAECWCHPEDFPQAEKLSAAPAISYTAGKYPAMAHGTCKKSWMAPWENSPLPTACYIHRAWGSAIDLPVGC